jgi:hypothetical protein
MSSTGYDCLYCVFGYTPEGSLLRNRGLSDDDTAKALAYMQSRTKVCVHDTTTVAEIGDVFVRKKTRQPWV